MPSVDASPSGSPYRPVPDLIWTSEGLVFPTPRSWFGENLSNRKTGTYWTLKPDAGPLDRRSGSSLFVGAGIATAKERRAYRRCPTSEEYTIISCSFITFNGHRWRRVVGRGSNPMVMYDAVVGSSAIHIVGFTDREGPEAMKPLDALIRRAHLVSKPGYRIALPGLARPQYVGDDGAAGVCGDTPGEIAEFVLEVDTPMPRCSVVHPRQRLRLVNNRKELVMARLGHLVAFLPPRTSVTVREPFDKYLQSGGYVIETTNGGGSELRLKP